MGAQGITTLDFGAFPGVSDVTVTITGQAGIISGSLIEAWLRPIDTGSAGSTTFHSADEHIMVNMRVIADNIVPGVGFDVTGLNMDEVNEPLEQRNPAGTATAPLRGYLQPSVGGAGTRIWGTWSVAWVWN